MRITEKCGCGASVYIEQSGPSADTEATIAEFIAARLADDEAAAKAATPGPWEVDHPVYPERIDAADGVSVVAGARWGDEASVFEDKADAFHIARHDPARVLAQCAAIRQIVALHGADPDDYGHVWCDRCNRSSWTPDAGGEDWPCRTLLAVASIWATHPDYRQEWTT